MTKTDLPTITIELYKLLEPHDADIRERAIKAVMVMLGGNLEVTAPDKKPSAESGEDEDGPALLPKVRAWMRTHAITREQVDHVFHLDGGVCEVLPSEAPGKNGKEQTINAYILTGISTFLQSGETRFDDKTARDVCKAMGCFNESNHAYYLKGRGNLLGGTKDAGWTLTGPSMKIGAELVRTLASDKN